MAPQILLPSTHPTFYNYINALTQAGATVCYGETEQDPTACDALLLPGGCDIHPRRYGAENIACHKIEEERDETELRLAHAFLAAGKPILGICRGHQLINVALGGTLIQDIPDHSAVGGIDTVHSVRTAEDSLLHALYGDTCLVNSAHHQVLDRLGDGLVPVQWCGEIIEGCAHRSLPVYSVQWHPERLHAGSLGRNTVSGQQLIDWFVSQCR